MMKNKKQVLDEIEEQAIIYEIQYRGCSGAVLASIKDILDIGNEKSFMASSALAAGVARSGETCGALIAALMAIGMVSGRKTIEDLDTYRYCMGLADEARSMFLDAVGHTLCYEIHKIIYGRAYNLKDEKDRELFEEAGGHKREGAPTVCGKAARIAAEIILREQAKKS